MREQPLDRRIVSRIDREAVQRVGRVSDDPATSDDRRCLGQGRRVRRVRIDLQDAHSRELSLRDDR